MRVTCSSLVTERNEPLSVRTSRSVVLTENVLKEEPEPGWRLLFREDFAYQREDSGNGVQVEHFCELPDVLCVAGPRGANVFSGQRASHRTDYAPSSRWRRRTGAAQNG